MSWDFETDADFQAELDWIDQFVREEVEPLEHVLGSPWNIHDPAFKALVKPLQQRVKERRLWACHLGPELGGPGYGQVKLALMNEILGRALFAPIVFGCQAPDSGNAEVLAHYGTKAQKERFLKPLLAGDIVSCFAMTEPQGGADPKVFTTRAVRDGDAWVINGRKWFASNARYANFFIVMAITDPEVSAYKGMSMFIVPAGTPGLSIIRNVGMADEPEATHAYLAFEDVRVPDDQMLGAPGEAFVVAQVRLGGGRVHHAMRTIGLAQKALDALCERALSRHTQGGALADKQMVQEKIADSWLELEQFRLLVMRTAWRIDRYQDYQKVRKDIAAVKAAMPRVLHDIAARALHVHGSIGASSEMPFAGMISRAFQMGLADGPTEVHKVTVAKQVLRDYAPCEQMFPAYHRPTAAASAHRKFAAVLGEGAAR
ncbi:acyl-CoA dehydrogenase family protein [Paraburkholderia dinghuensis]|uniref:Acyl-CoA dehydrogenase n=1 Tax=Paraburkholderia dinghuensis TaxID=2305225 RepID=A0A3N6PSI6_9BURK|nr:acyl-CoA dehydrogenase family protein [Paraburkholderia dinghuensis]RQH04940.1 acyl-CoA dehydrogenase [Paraburkholderia dinghuensis]